jgi:dihydroxyacetone kinase-like protein
MAIVLKKFMNHVDGMLIEALRGFGDANGHLICVHENPLYVTRRNTPVGGKVALISGGGSGHEPLHLGYVGRGMLDAACPGEIFTSPTPDQIEAAARSVDGGAGILFIVKNYSGDRMNFEIAEELLDLPLETVVVSDEALPLDSDPASTRRGMAGTVLVEKMVGAAAEAGADLKKCKHIGDKVNSVTRTMGVALTSCVIPAVRKPTFVLAEDELEMGVGIHGEPGRKRIKRMPVNDLVHQMIEAISTDLAVCSGDQVLLHVNGFGGTPLIELYLVYHAAAKICRAKGLEIVRSLVGNHTTSLEMAGCSITMSLLDEQLLRLWDAPVHTPCLCWG